MATTTLTPTSLSKNTASGDLPAAGGTAVVAADTVEIAYPKEGRLLIQLNNTFAGAKTFTFAAGFGVASGQGALTVSLDQDDVKYIVLSSDRFKDSSGNVSMTFESGTTGFYQAFYLP